MNNELVTTDMNSRVKMERELQAIRENRKNVFDSLMSRIAVVNSRNVKTPKTVRLTVENLKMILAFTHETEFTQGQFEKYSSRLSDFVDQLEGKESPKSKTSVIGETILTIDQLQKRAKLYLYRQYELSELTKEYEARKEILTCKIQDVKSKIPMAQESEFSALLVELSPAYGDNTPIAKPDDMENEVE